MMTEHHLQQLIMGLSSSDIDVQEHAATELGRIKSTEAIPHLLQLMLAHNEEDDSYAVRAAARAIESFGVAGVPALQEALQSGAKTAREHAGVSLSYMGEAAVPALIEALGNKNERVREIALYSLLPMGEPTVPFLLRAIRDENSKRRTSALIVLSRIQGARVRDHVEAALSDESEEMRKAAEQLLKRIHRKRDRSEDFDGLQDERSDRRANHAYRLGNGQVEEAVPYLLPLLSDTANVTDWGWDRSSWIFDREPVRVCDVVTEALRRIGTPEALAAIHQSSTT